MQLLLKSQVGRGSVLSILVTIALIALPIVRSRSDNPPSSAHTVTQTSVGASTKSASFLPIKTPLRLAYAYKLGDVRRYKVTGFISGHFPPFAEKDSPPIHVMILLDYETTVKKVTDKGAEVEFNVEEASVNVLEKEPAEGQKPNPADIAEFPIPLAQVQGMFNAVATLKPSGSIVSIQGGDTSKVKLDIGVDLRKLFLLTAPIIFSDKVVKIGDEWQFDDGLLGSKPGKTTYSGHLQAVSGEGKRVVASISQLGNSVVNTQLDKEGNSTDKPKAIVGSLVGKVDLNGTARVVGTMDSGAAPAASGRIDQAKVALTVDLKRTLPDPDQDGKVLITDIDVKARFYVVPGMAPSTSVQKSASKAPPSKPSNKKTTAQKGVK